MNLIVQFRGWLHHPGKHPVKLFWTLEHANWMELRLNVLESSPIVVQKLMGGRQTFTIDDADSALNCEGCFLLYFSRVVG